MGSQPIYHLSSLPPPPSIAEPGSNSLDDVLKAPGESEYQNLFINYFKYIVYQNIRQLETKTICKDSETGNIWKPAN